MHKILLTLPEVKEILVNKPGAKFIRKIWDKCRYIRAAIPSDYDAINYDINGVIVEDCKAKVCDCAIGVWAFTPEDVDAKDYIEIV